MKKRYDRKVNIAWGRVILVLCIVAVGVCLAFLLRYFIKTGKRLTTGDSNTGVVSQEEIQKIDARVGKLEEQVQALEAGPTATSGETADEATATDQTSTEQASAEENTTAETAQDTISEEVLFQNMLSALSNTTRSASIVYAQVTSVEEEGGQVYLRYHTAERWEGKEAVAQQFGLGEDAPSLRIEYGNTTQRNAVRGITSLDDSYPILMQEATGLKSLANFAACKERIEAGDSQNDFVLIVVEEQITGIYGVDESA